MKKFETIKNGDRINTLIGFIDIKNCNAGNLIHVEEYEIAECGYPIKSCDRWLTIHEIENEAKSFDGRNRNFVYQKDTDLFD